MALKHRWFGPPYWRCLVVCFEQHVLRDFLGTTERPSAPCAARWSGNFRSRSYVRRPGPIRLWSTERRAAHEDRRERRDDHASKGQRRKDWWRKDRCPARLWEREHGSNCSQI